MVLTLFEIYGITITQADSGVKLIKKEGFTHDE